MSLSYKKLDVYQASVSFLKLAFDFIAPLPKGHAKLADQFRRAAMSVPLNIAEAAGKVSPAEAKHHFAIARGSAMECGAILDVLKLVDSARPKDMNSAEELVIRIVSMLTRMCR